MEKYIKVKEIGEPNNRLAIFAEVLEEGPIGINYANIYTAADPNPSEQERLCEVTVRLIDNKNIYYTYVVRQLGKGSTKDTHVVTRGPKLIEVVISADGTEKKPNEYERID